MWRCALQARRSLHLVGACVAPEDAPAAIHQQERHRGGARDLQRRHDSAHVGVDGQRPVAHHRVCDRGGHPAIDEGAGEAVQPADHRQLIGPQIGMGGHQRLKIPKSRVDQLLMPALKCDDRDVVRAAKVCWQREHTPVQVPHR